MCGAIGASVGHAGMLIEHHESSGLENTPSCISVCALPPRALEEGWPSKAQTLGTERSLAAAARISGWDQWVESEITVYLPALYVLQGENRSGMFLLRTGAAAGVARANAPRVFYLSVLSLSLPGARLGCHASKSIKVDMTKTPLVDFLDRESCLLVEKGPLNEM